MTTGKRSSLLRGEQKNRQHGIADISHGIKSLAKELNVPGFTGEHPGTVDKAFGFCGSSACLNGMPVWLLYFTSPTLVRTRKVCPG